MNLLDALECALSAGIHVPEVMRAYRTAIKRLAEHGVATTQDLTPVSLARYLTTRTLSAKASTARCDLVALGCALRFVARLDRDEARRCREVVREGRPRLPVRLAWRARYLDRATYERVVAAADDSLDRIAVQVLTLSGLRVGEACRLRWGVDVELGEAPLLHVREMPELGAAGRCKTGERVVPVCSELRDILRRLWRPSGYVLTRRRRRDAPSDRGVLQNRLRDLRARVGLPWLTCHVLRHTRAAWWLQGGVSLARVSLWLGHTPEICARFYGALATGYDPECERVPRAWGLAS